jgi:hypothetical protein
VQGVCVCTIVVTIHLCQSKDCSAVLVLSLQRATSWNPQQSRITRENKDYMTAVSFIGSFIFQWAKREREKDLTDYHVKIYLPVKTDKWCFDVYVNFLTDIRE